MIRTRYDREIRRYDLSWVRSLDRREASAAQRRVQRRRETLAVLAAVAGLILVIYYCTLDTPWHSWYIGLIGTILIIPWLTRRFN